MKTALRMSLMAAVTLASVSVQAHKKVKTFRVEKVINLSAAEVWAVVGEDYGAVANSHPKIVNSEYTNGSLKAEEGAERMCYFNEKGTQFLHEQMVNYDPANMQFTNKVYKAGKFPVDPAYTEAVYNVESLGPNKCSLSFDMEFRTKPAVMGGMMKGSFKKLIEDYFIAIEHYAKTGEKVNQDNFKEIKKLYPS